MIMLTIDFKDLLLAGLLVALIVFVIYLIVLVANVIKTVKKANAMLDDTKVVSGIAAERAAQINGVVDEVAVSVSGFVSSVNQNESVISSLKGLTKAVQSFSNIVRRGKK